MSDGGGETGIELELQNAKRKFRGNDFDTAIAKIAVAQICESEGFQSCQQSALEALSDVAVRYIRELGKTANFHATLAGRSECNVFDIIQGLEDLGSAQGFFGASDTNHCLSSSGTVREISQYIVAEEIPFVYAVPQFPAVKDQKPIQSFLQIGKEPPGEHIPAWLPAFPDPHTYVHLLSQSEKAAGNDTDKVEQERQHRKEEPSILNLQQRLACNGPGPSAVGPGDAAKVKQSVESNPFLAAPLRFGEKEVSSVVFPAKLSNETVLEYPVTENPVMENHMSELETSAPAIEAMKSNSCNSGDGAQKVPLNQRPTVQFKIGIREKSLGSTVDLNLQRQGVRKVSSWFGKDNEKDDKKRRAEQILNDSMDQELAQL